MTDAGADVAERRYGQTKRVEQGVTHGYHEETRHHDEDEVDHKEGKYGATHLGGNLGVVDAHGEHGMGMQHLAKLGFGELPYHEHANALETTAGGSGTGSDDTDERENEPNGGVPNHKVFVGKTGGTLQRNGVEKGYAQRGHDVDAFNKIKNARDA